MGSYQGGGFVKPAVARLAEVCSGPYFIKYFCRIIFWGTFFFWDFLALQVPDFGKIKIAKIVLPAFLVQQLVKNES